MKSDGYPGKYGPLPEATPCNQSELIKALSPEEVPISTLEDEVNRRIQALDDGIPELEQMIVRLKSCAPTS